MMDLKEAAASIDYYTNRFDLACALYSHAVETGKQLENDEKLKGYLAERQEVKDTTIADLNRLQREVMTLRILIEQASGREADRLLYMIDDFLALRNAVDRNTLAFNKATELLNEHQKKLAEESAKAEAEARRIAWEASRPKTQFDLAMEEFNRERAAKNAAALSPAEVQAEVSWTEYPHTR